MRISRKIGGRAALLAAALALIGAAAPMAATAADGAFVTHENISGRATFPIDNPCNGETFLATSTFQFVTTIYSTPSGIQGKATSSGRGPDGTTEDFFFHVTMIAILDLDAGTAVLEVGHSSTECR